MVKMHKIHVTSKQAFDAFRLMIYLLLFSLGVLFIHQGKVWERYAQRKTNFAIYTEPFSELPTITSYIQTYGLKLGADFNLTFQALRSGALNSSTKPTQLTASGIYQVPAEESYEPFKIAFENNLYGDGAFKITPVISPEVSLYHIGDLAVTYTFSNANTLNSERLIITLSLTPENNSIAGSFVIGKTKVYDGKKSTYQGKMGQTSKLVYAATKYINIDIDGCRDQPFNELLFHKISDEIKNCTRPCRIKDNYGHKLNSILSHLPICKDEFEKSCFLSVAKRAHQGIHSTPCTRLEYTWLETQDFLAEQNCKMTFILQMGSPKRVSVNEEYLIYDFVAMISAIGGTLGLCIGFSFFDFCDLILRYSEKGVQKMKVGRKVVTTSVIREIRSPLEIVQEKLETISESVADMEGKMSAMENSIKTLQIKVMPHETK